MRIYTRKGDKGETGVAGGRRVGKDHPVVEACGSVDELNSFLGWARSLAPEGPVGEQIEKIQRHLLELGADLAALSERVSADRAPMLTPSRVELLEGWIDRYEGELPSLARFILPGGSQAGAALHVCRTVCRRAEREVVRAVGAEPAGETILAYLNRLSDLLFVLGRWVNHQAGVEEAVWEGRRGI